jgi:hypothetical protein
MTLLLETVVGLGIFTAAMLLIFGLFASSQKATVSSKNLAVAADLARETMETELTKGYAGVTDLGPVDIPMPTTVDGVETTTTYTSEVQVFDEAASSADNPFAFPRKRILVTVSWPEVTGAARKTQLETYLVP